MKNTITIICLMAFCLIASKGLSQNEHPNLLFIMTDQQRFDALSMAGNTVLETPNLDRLAREGAFFTNAYTQAAVCAPARASILTGFTIENTGLKTNELVKKATRDSGIMPQPTFDEILVGNGYSAEHYGKWHNPVFHGEVYSNKDFGSLHKDYLDYLDKHIPIRPLKKGELYDTFSERPYVPNPMDRRYGASEKELMEWAKGRHPQPDLHGKLSIPSKHSYTAFQAKKVMDAIERHKNHPFTITSSFNHPHAPMLPSPEYYHMYPVEDMVPPISINDDMVNSPYSAANKRLNLPEYSDPNEIRYMMTDYYSMIKEVDDWIGKILDKLDELNLTNNTMVVFTSDHGEMLGAHGMREKNVFYEESAHIPLIIRYPVKIKSHTVVNQYVSTLDLFATILDYMGQKAPASDGKSLRDVIENKETQRKNYLVTEWDYRGDVQPNYMIIKEGWKLMVPYTKESKVIDALYHLPEDPSEINNLIGNNPDRYNYKEKVAELKADLLEWLKTHNSEHYQGVLNREIIK